MTFGELELRRHVVGFTQLTRDLSFSLHYFKTVLHLFTALWFRGYLAVWLIYLCILTIYCLVRFRLMCHKSSFFCCKDMDSKVKKSIKKKKKKNHRISEFWWISWVLVIIVTCYTKSFRSGFLTKNLVIVTISCLVHFCWMCHKSSCICFLLEQILNSKEY